MTTGTNGPDDLVNDASVFNETVDALDGDDLINIVTPLNPGNPGPTVTVNGGNGTDRIVLVTAESFQAMTGSGTGGALSVRTGAGQQYAVIWNSIERLTLNGALFGDGPFVTGDSIDELTLTGTLSRANIFTQGGADVITLTGAFVAANIESGAGDDIVDLRGLTSVLETVVIQGGDGNDILFAHPTIGNFSGGNGDDAIVFLGSLTAADGADGGAGTDTVVVQGNYPALVLGAGFVNNEVLLVASGDDTRFGQFGGNSYDYNITTIDSNVAAGAILTVSATILRAGEDLVFNGAAETNGAFRIFAGAGTDTLTGGAAQDGFFFGDDNILTGADTINGLGGTDSVALRGNHNVAFQDTTFLGIEVIALLSGLTNEFGGPIVIGGFDYNLILADGNIAAGQRMDIVASGLAGTESVNIDASLETNGSVRILSGAADDTLRGTANGDILYGGLGADQLTGGGGPDVYLYRSVPESSIDEWDAINFGAGDRIDLSSIDANPATGTNDAFTFIGSGAFTNTPGQLRVVDGGSNSWNVLGDTNGDGTADLVIVVSYDQPLTAGDFVL